MINEKILLQLLRSFLRPFFKLCLKSPLRLKQIYQCSKEVFIEVAQRELESRGQELTISKLSVMSGVHRKDVKSILDSASEKRATLSNIPFKVVTEWRRLKKRSTKAITYGTADSDFHKLVLSVSQDLNPATVLFELERLGIVEKSKNTIKLSSDAEVLVKSFEDGIGILSEDINDLSHAVIENCSESRDPENLNLHKRTIYDRISDESLPAVRAFLREEGQQFHERARLFLENHDADHNQDVDPSKSTSTVVLGAYSITYKQEEI